MSRPCRTGKRMFHDQAAAKVAITRIRQSGEKRERSPSSVRVPDLPTLAPDLTTGVHLTTKTLVVASLCAVGAFTVGLAIHVAREVRYPQPTITAADLARFRRKVEREQ